MIASRPDKVFVDTVNLIRASDLLLPPPMDVEGLVELLFPASDRDDILNHPDVEKIILTKVTMLHEFGGSPEVLHRVSELMGISKSLISSKTPWGVEVMSDTTDVEADNYALSWNFYLNEGGRNLMSIGSADEIHEPFMGNDMYVGLFLEFHDQEKKGIPLGLLPVIPLFSGKALQSALRDERHADKIAQSLSAFFASSANVPFEPETQANLFVERQAANFLLEIGAHMNLIHDEHKQVIIELHRSVMESFDRLLPAMHPQTTLLPINFSDRNYL